MDEESLMIGLRDLLETWADTPYEDEDDRKDNDQ